MQAFDFDGAITFHRSWKMKFHLALNSIHGKDFDTQLIGDDAQCKLGLWLAANSSELAGSKLAGKLLKVHEEFHHRAKLIADDIRNGAIVQLNDNAIVDFGLLSERIETLLRQLKAELDPPG